MTNPLARTPVQRTWRLYRPFPREASQAWRTALLILTGSLLHGCDAPKSEPLAPPVSTPAIMSSFDPSAARNISGRVRWNGPEPQAPAFEIMPNPLGGTVLQKRQRRPNPNVPKIDPLGHGIVGAVVFLRDVDPARAKPWDLSSVSVEQRDCQIRILQGTESASVGFVRQGDTLEMVSRDPWLHALHVGGASFFTLMFPDPDLPLRRKLMAPGLVELSSNAGYFWMRGYLFVADHPYYCRTDRDGNFALKAVPPGSYRLTVWLPNWRVARQERDPESGLVSRLFFEPPIEQEQPLLVGTEDKSNLLLELPGEPSKPPAHH